MQRTSGDAEAVVLGLNRNVFSPSIGLAAVLAVLAAVEIHAALRPLGAPLQAAAALPLDLTTADSGNPPAAVLAGRRAALLARPLFNPSRRPPVIASVQWVVPRLSGIMVTPTERIAVFSPVHGNPIIVAKNSRFGAFTVLFIGADSVMLQGPQGILVLRSGFGAAAGSARITLDKGMLPGGIDLDLIRVPPPSPATWNGPPMAN
jgi:hypothetical protein